MRFYLPWSTVHTVLLDMDGTLLDLRFDNHLWRERIPESYALRHGLSLDQARTEVQTLTQAQKGTLNWYSLDYWSEALDVDIEALQREIAHLITIHPYVLEFLEALRRTHKRVVLVTNAHWSSLALKMEKTGLAAYFDALICAHGLGWVKEQLEFWPRLQEVEPFSPETTLLVDDNPDILRTAQRYGIAWLISVLRPDSADPPRMPDRFLAIRDFSELMPVI